MRLLITRGLPGSGKSTWARGHAAAHRGRVGIVSRDVIREHVLGLTMTSGDQVLDRAGEDLVTAVVEATARALLAAGLDVIADAMHLRDGHLAPWRALAAKYGATVEVVDFEVPIEECIRRDANRAASGGRGVGVDVIRAIAATGGPVGMDITR